MVVSGRRGRVDERKGRRNCLDARIDVDLGKTEADIKRERGKETRFDVKCKQRKHHQSPKLQTGNRCAWAWAVVGRAAGRSAREN